MKYLVWLVLFSIASTQRFCRSFTNCKIWRQNNRALSLNITSIQLGEDLGVVTAEGRDW